MPLSVVDLAEPPSKRAIVSAALRLFARDGFKETTIRAIADDAGYTNPALFKFFASKDELGAFVFVRCYRAFVAEIEPHMNDDGPLDDALRGWVHAYLTLLTEQRDVVLFVHEHAATFWPIVKDELGDEPFSLLGKWLRRARSAGRVSTSPPQRLQALVVVGAFHQIARHIDVSAMRPAQRRELENDTARMLAAALRA